MSQKYVPVAPRSLLTPLQFAKLVDKLAKECQSKKPPHFVKDQLAHRRCGKTYSCANGTLLLRAGVKFSALKGLHSSGSDTLARALGCYRLPSSVAGAFERVASTNDDAYASRQERTMRVVAPLKALAAEIRAWARRGG
jgi:hypothetical protein